MKTVYYGLKRWFQRLFRAKIKDGVDPRLEQYTEYLVNNFMGGSTLGMAGGEYIDEEIVKRELDYALKNPL